MKEVLGKNGDLIWKLKGDMKFFRETTIGHTIVMGRKTFESLPKVLPERKYNHGHRVAGYD